MSDVDVPMGMYPLFGGSVPTVRQSDLYEWTDGGTVGAQDDNLGSGLQSPYVLVRGRRLPYIWSKRDKRFSMVWGPQVAT